MPASSGDTPLLRESPALLRTLADALPLALRHWLFLPISADIHLPIRCRRSPKRIAKQWTRPARGCRVTSRPNVRARTAPVGSPSRTEWEATPGPSLFSWPGGTLSLPAQTPPVPVRCRERGNPTETTRRPEGRPTLRASFRWFIGQEGERHTHSERTFVLAMVVSGRNVRGLPRRSTHRLGDSSRVTALDAHWEAPPAVPSCRRGREPLPYRSPQAQRLKRSRLSRVGNDRSGTVHFARGNLAVSEETLTASTLHNGSQPPGGRRLRANYELQGDPDERALNAGVEAKPGMRAKPNAALPDHIASKQCPRTQVGRAGGVAPRGHWRNSRCRDIATRRQTSYA